MVDSCLIVAVNDGQMMINDGLIMADNGQKRESLVPTVSPTFRGCEFAAGSLPEKPSLPD